MCENCTGTGSMLPDRRNKGFIGEIRLPNGFGGGSRVSLNSPSGKRRSVFLPPHLTEVLLKLNQRFKEDTMPDSEERGLTGYETLGALIVRDDPRRYPPEPRTLSNYCSKLNKKLREASEFDRPIVAFIPRTGVRLTGEFLVINEKAAHLTQPA